VKMFDAHECLSVVTMERPNNSIKTAYPSG